MRLFVGLECSTEIKQRLSLLRLTPERGVTVTDTENFHITLQFIGEADAGVVDRALRTVRSSSFSIQVSGYGQFNLKQGRRIVWAGVATNESLTQLHRQIGETLRAANVHSNANSHQKENRFVPHVTLARLGRDSSDGIFSWLGRQSDINMSQAVDHFCLFKSAISAGKTRYRILERYPLCKSKGPAIGR